MERPRPRHLSPQGMYTLLLLLPLLLLLAAAVVATTFIDSHRTRAFPVEVEPSFGTRIPQDIYSLQAVTAVFNLIS